MNLGGLLQCVSLVWDSANEFRGSESIAPFTGAGLDGAIVRRRRW